MYKIRVIFEKIENVFINISLLSIFLMMLAIFADVTMRYIFNSPIPGITEMSGDYFMVLIVFLAISYTHKENGHVKADVIESRLSKKMKVILDIFKGLLIILVLSIIFISSINIFFEYLQNDVRSVGSIEYLIAPAYLVIAIGLLLMIIRLVLNIVDILQSFSKRDLLTSYKESGDKS